MKSYLFPILFLACLVGCSGPTAEVVEITGTVTQNGKPLDEVKITFSPDPVKEFDGMSSDAITDKDGKYRLRYKGDSAEFGAEVGWHKVTVLDVKAENSRDNPIPPRISQRYSIAGKTDLEREIKSGESQTFDFELDPRN